jgi:hypothetical protein
MFMVIKSFFVGQLRKVRNFFRYLKAVFQYAKLLKRDYNYFDWDHSGLLNLIEYKIKRMVKAFSSDKAMCAKASEKVRKMKFALSMIDIINNHQDWKYETLLKPHYEKWGEPKLKTKELSDGIRIVEIIYPNVETKEQDEQERKEYMELTIKAEEHLNYLYQQLFEFIGKNIRNWWD